MNAPSIAAFIGLLVLLIVAALLALLARDVLTPLPYHDPEPPTSRTRD